MPGRDEQVLEGVHAIQEGRAVRRQRAPADPELFWLPAIAAWFELIPAVEVLRGPPRDGLGPGPAEGLVVAAELHRARDPQAPGERRDGDLDVPQVDGPPGQGTQPAQEAVSLARGQRQPDAEGSQQRSA